MRKKVIQIGGTVRSGTTITGLLLGTTRNAMMLGEIEHLFKPYTTNHRRAIEVLKKDKAWSRILSADKRDLYEAIFNEFPKVETLIDSSKDPFWFEDKARSSGVDIRVLVTYKKLHELDESFKKRDMKNSRKVFVNYYRRFFTLFPNAKTCHSISLLSSEGNLKKVYAYLDLQYAKVNLEYDEEDHPNFFGSKTVKGKHKIELKEYLSSENKSFPLNKIERSVQDILKGKDLLEDSRLRDVSQVEYSSTLMRIYELKDYHLKNIFF